MTQTESINEGTLVLTCRSDAAFGGVDSGPAKGPAWLTELKSESSQSSANASHS